jgi:hypothetical protein
MKNRLRTEIENVINEKRQKTKIGKARGDYSSASVIGNILMKNDVFCSSYRMRRISGVFSAFKAETLAETMRHRIK